MSEISLRKRIENAVYIDNNFLAISNGTDTHYDEHSQEMTDVEMLDIILSGKKNVQSKFVSDSWKEDHLEGVIGYKAKAIAEFVNPPYEDRPRNYRIEAFSANYPIEENENHIGIGFIKNPDTGKIAEYASDDIKFVIKTDRNAELGFYMHTAYPDIENNKDVIKTNRDLSSILKQTESYKNASPMEKAYMEYQISPDEPESLSSLYLISDSSHQDDAIVIKQKTKNPNIERMIKIRQSTSSVQFRNKSTKEIIPIKVNDKNRKTLPLEKCMRKIKETSPKTADVIDKIKHTINESRYEKIISDSKHLNNNAPNNNGHDEFE